MRRDWKGASDTVLRVDGGMVASDWTMQRLADILDAPVDRPTVLETTALGAAWLAGRHCGAWPDMDGFSARWRLERRFEPAMGAVERGAKLKGWSQAVRRTLTKRWPVRGRSAIAIIETLFVRRRRNERSRCRRHRSRSAVKLSGKSTAGPTRRSLEAASQKTVTSVPSRGEAIWQPGLKRSRGSRSALIPARISCCTGDRRAAKSSRFSRPIPCSALMPP